MIRSSCAHAIVRCFCTKVSNRRQMIVCSRTAYSALEPQCPQSTTSKVALHEVKVRGGQQREDLQRLLGHTQCQVADTVCV